jgi:hypothetical protein
MLTLSKEEGRICTLFLSADRPYKASDPYISLSPCDMLHKPTRNQLTSMMADGQYDIRLRFEVVSFFENC